MPGESIFIHAPAERVWAMVSDVTRMGEWSPEAVRAEWLDGANGPSVGARAIQLASMDGGVAGTASSTRHRRRRPAQRR